jgi:ATP-dependent Clp protease ATP-binding subunit ClpA
MVDRPKPAPSGAKTKKQTPDAAENLTAILAQKVVGQPAATKVIVPYIQMYQAGLAPEGRPVGIFLLLGPTGTGKTKTVEALAEILHGSEKSVLKVDCGEFQMEHEVAKLLARRPLSGTSTQPMLTAEAECRRRRCGLSLVLLDEIEKAAPSLTRPRRALDKGVLRLGDNSSVNFEKSLVFLTSNLGAREMWKEDLG